jgi:hypothetical protein
MTTEQMDEKDRQEGYVGVTPQGLVDKGRPHYGPEVLSLPIGDPRLSTPQSEWPENASLRTGTDYHVRVNGGDEKVMTTMAEEEPARRDKRNWLDGYLMGFREGFERGAQ